MPNDSMPLLLQGDKEGPEPILKVEYGISWTPQTFVQRAAGLSHPGHFLDGIHDVLAESFGKLARLPPPMCWPPRELQQWGSERWGLRSSSVREKMASNHLPATPRKSWRTRTCVCLLSLLRHLDLLMWTWQMTLPWVSTWWGHIPSGGMFPHKPLFATLLRELQPGMQLIGQKMMTCVRRFLMQQWKSAGRGGCVAPSPLTSCQSHRFWRAVLESGNRQLLQTGAGPWNSDPLTICTTNSCDESIQPMGVDAIWYVPRLSGGCRRGLGTD